MVLVMCLLLTNQCAYAKILVPGGFNLNCNRAHFHVEKLFNLLVKGLIVFHILECIFKVTDFGVENNIWNSVFYCFIEKCSNAWYCFVNTMKFWKKTCTTLQQNSFRLGRLFEWYFYYPLTNAIAYIAGAHIRLILFN